MLAPNNIHSSEAGQAHLLSPPGLFECAEGLIRRYVPSGSRIVDLCAGTGELSLRLAREGHQLTNADIDKGWYRAETIPHVLLDLNRPFAERLGKNQYHAVICLEGIEHLENPWGLLRECRQLLIPGGILILSTPNVECLQSRLLFLLTGGLLTFDRTMACDKHITPVFSWLLLPNLRQAGFELAETVYLRTPAAATGGWKMRLLHAASKFAGGFLGEASQSEDRIVIARAVDTAKRLSSQRDIDEPAGIHQEVVRA